MTEMITNFIAMTDIIILFTIGVAMAGAAAITVSYLTHRFNNGED